MTLTTRLITTRQPDIISMEAISMNTEASAATNCWRALKRTLVPSKHAPRTTTRILRAAAPVGEIISTGGADDTPDAQNVHKALTAVGFHRLHTYEELEALGRIPGYEYLARDVKLQQMKILSEELQEVTQVDLCEFDGTLDAALGTSRLDLSGIMHSIDVEGLNSRLRDKGDDSYAILTLHPDDWVAGRSQPADPEARWCNWALHGRMDWATRPTGDPDVREELVSLLPPGPDDGDDGQRRRRPPGTGAQHGRAVTSPVVDHLVMELADEGSAPLLKYLPNAVTFIDAHLAAAGRRVLVHCKVGHSRSASVVAAYLLHRYHHGVVVAGRRGGRGGGDDARWADAASTARHLRRQCDTILAWLRRKRPGVRAAEENNFTQQLHAYADYLAYGVMPPIPPAKIKRDGGDQMRDAAAVVFFQHGQRPFLNLLRHYFETRTPAFYRFPEGMHEFMLKWLVLENLRWNWRTKLLENTECNT